MAISINLLPDVMQEKRAAKARRYTVTVAASIVCGVSVGAVLLLLVISGAQSITLSSLQKSINQKQGQLEAVEGLQPALTSQSHLSSLANLYKQRSYTSGLFNLITSFTPKDVSYGSLEFTANGELKLGGKAKNYATLTKLVRDFEGAGVTVGPGANASNPSLFTNVALVSATNDGDGKVTFALTATTAPGVTHGTN